MDGTRLAVIGKSGYGKSYWTKKTLIPILVKFKPVIIFDRKGEYAGKKAVDSNPDWIALNGFAGFFERVNISGGIEKKVYVIKCDHEKDYINGFSFFQRLSAPVSIIIEEAHDIYKAKDFFAAKEPLLRMVRWGRSEGVDIIPVTQRTMDMPPDIRSQITAWIVFHQNHDDDVKELSKSGYTEAESVKTLEKTEFIHFGEMPKHIERKI